MPIGPLFRIRAGPRPRVFTPSRFRARRIGSRLADCIPFVEPLFYAYPAGFSRRFPSRRPEPGAFPFPAL